MKFKANLLAVAVLHSLAFSAYAQNPHTVNDPIQTNNDANFIEAEPTTITFNWAWVVSQVAQAAVSALQSGIKSALQDAIFGSSSPGYVTLSQESLAQIQSLIQAGFDQDALEGMVNSLQSLELSMKSYSDQLVNYGSRNTALLANMETQSNTLYTHQAFNTNKPYYPDITVQYSAAASLRYAILADKVFYGENSKAFIESQGTQMATSLNAMASATEMKVSNNVFMTQVQTGNCVISRSVDLDVTPTAICWNYFVYDLFSNTTYSYRYQDYGSLNYQVASQKLSTLRSDYNSQIKGDDYSTVINSLTQTYN